MMLRSLIRSIISESLGSSWGLELLDVIPVASQEPSFDIVISNIKKIKRIIDNSQDLVKLGEGAYRNTYKFKDNPFIVLKVAKSDLSIEDSLHMNKHEIKLGRDARHIGVFPRTYAFDPGGVWFVQERVMDVDLPSDEWAQRICDYFLPGNMPVEEGRLDCTEDDVVLLFFAMEYAVAGEKILALSSLDPAGEDAVREIAKRLKASGQNLWWKWGRALVDKDVGIHDLRPANVGFSMIKDESGINPPIIHDASIF